MIVPFSRPFRGNIHLGAGLAKEAAMALGGDPLGGRPAGRHSLFHFGDCRFDFFGAGTPRSAKRWPCHGDRQPAGDCRFTFSAGVYDGGGSRQRIYGGTPILCQHADFRSGWFYLPFRSLSTRSPADPLPDGPSKGVATEADTYRRRKAVEHHRLCRQRAFARSSR